MQRNSRVLVSAALFLSLFACDNPDGPTPPPPACTYTLSATTLSLPASGGAATVSVATTSQCAWTASSDREWMSITSGASGTGNGTVNVLVTVNPGPTVRTGTLTVAGQAVAVREEAQPACTVTLTPSGIALSPGPYNGTFAVASPSYCQWTAVSAAPWLTVTSGNTGTGNGTVAYASDRNRETTARSAAIVVSDKSFVVTQEAEVSCDYTVTPVQFTPCMPATTMSAIVTTQATCSWTAAPAASWITLTGGQSGTGPGLVSFSVSDNYDAPRQGIVEVRWPTPTAGQNLLVLQAGCYYGVSTNTINLTASGGAAYFEVVQQSDPQLCGGPTQNACVWTAVSQAAWITVTTPMPQQGDSRVNFVVAPNNTGAPRTGTIVVRDKTVTIIQPSL